MAVVQVDADFIVFNVDAPVSRLERTKPLSDQRFDLFAGGDRPRVVCPPIIHCDEGLPAVTGISHVEGLMYAHMVLL